MSLKNVFKKRKNNKQREDGNLQSSILHDLIADTVSKLVNEKFEEYFSGLENKLENEVKDKTDFVLNNVKKGKDGEDGESIIGDKGDKGDKGDSGDSPTKKSLIKLIKPLIPNSKIGKDGKSIIGGKGDKGDAGSPDEPKDIVKKLNTLENVLDIKVLKGLNHILKSIQDSVRSAKKGSSGGGMGLPVHQSFPCDGATTEFTLDYNVAAQGQAAWIHYQGQFLANNTHWSVSSKTLTLTFTPEAGTFVDITYIRS